MRCAATRAVDPPTEPAVCTRNIGLPDRTECRSQVELGHHHPLEHVGRLADHHRVDVAPAEVGVLEGHLGRLADHPAMETSSRFAL